MIVALKVYKTCRSATWAGAGNAGFPRGPFELAKLLYRAFGVETKGRRVSLKDAGDYWFSWLDDVRPGDIEWDAPVTQGRVKVALGRRADGTPA